MMLTGTLLLRYAIDDASADWTMAEAQVSNLASGATAGKSTVVTVKSTAAAGQKRKADTDAPTAKGEKKTRRSLKKPRQQDR